MPSNGDRRPVYGGRHDTSGYPPDDPPRRFDDDEDEDEEVETEKEDSQ